MQDVGAGRPAGHGVRADPADVGGQDGHLVEAFGGQPVEREGRGQGDLLLGGAPSHRPVGCDRGGVGGGPGDVRAVDLGPQDDVAREVRGPEVEAVGDELEAVAR